MEDGADEEGCQCTREDFKCEVGGGCVKMVARCDGTTDCADGSDEWNCVRLNLESTLQLRYYHQHDYHMTHHVTLIRIFNLVPRLRQIRTRRLVRRLRWGWRLARRSERPRLPTDGNVQGPGHGGEGALHDLRRQFLHPDQRDPRVGQRHCLRPGLGHHYPTDEASSSIMQQHSHHQVPGQR